MKSAKTFRGALWILGEYCDSKDAIQAVMTLLRQSLGDLPIVDTEIRLAGGEGVDDSTTNAASTADTEMKVQVGSNLLLTGVLRRDYWLSIVFAFFPRLCEASVVRPRR